MSYAEPRASQPLVVSERDVTRDVWNDKIRGVLGFRTLFSGGITPTAMLTAGIADLGEGEWLGLHRHAPTEIYYIVEGEGILTLEGVEHPVSAGTAVHIPGDAEHGIRNSSPTPLRFFYAFAVDSFDEVTYRFSE
jgi:mannose-6-phosphate isomerase-like protein (cupin superfamily)